MQHAEDCGSRGCRAPSHRARLAVRPDSQVRLTAATAAQLYHRRLSFRLSLGTAAANGYFRYVDEDKDEVVLLTDADVEDCAAADPKARLRRGALHCGTHASLVHCDGSCRDGAAMH